MSDLVLSLFPGLGLLDRAFEEEGFCVVRGPDVLWGGDVCSFRPPAGRFEGVIGGPPCQTFSALARLVRAQGNETRFGNLIPEFERVVAESSPAWFLMENVPAAPVPEVEGYAVRDFVICNSWISGDDGFGQEQERKRRFSFGVRGEGPAPNLRRWIVSAALLLPKTSAVLGDARETPVAIGGSGKVKRSRQPAVVAGGDDPPGQRRKTTAVLAARTRQPAVLSTQGNTASLGPSAFRSPEGRRRTGAVTGKQAGAGTLYPAEGGRAERRSIADMCRLQGLPEDFLADAPFTVDGKRKAIANGVPLPMGRAVARAVREALAVSASVDLTEGAR